MEDGVVSKLYHICMHGYDKVMFAFSPQRLKAPLLSSNGSFREVSLDEAISRAAEVLKSSKKPLLYGWSCATNEAIDLGLKIAKKLGGIFDGTMWICHGYSIYLAKKLGMGLPKLEEVLNNADHVVFWGANPGDNHLRHMSRYAVFPRGERVPRGIETRMLSAVDIRMTSTVKVAMNKLLINPGGDAELLSALISELEGTPVQREEVAGIPLKTFLEFVDVLKQRPYTAIFYGLGLTHSGKGKKNVELLYRLVQLLNRNGKSCIAMPMAGHYNMVGAVVKSLDAGGGPFAIDFSEGGEVVRRGESALDALLSWEYDSALIVGSDPLSSLPLEIAQRIRSIPAIVLDYRLSLTAKHANVVIPVAVPGVESGGHATRMDEEVVALSPIEELVGHFPSDQEVLDRLLKQL